MSRNYSPKTFLRQTPNRILKEYFHSKKLLQDIDFDNLREMDIDSIYEAMENLAGQFS